MAVDWQPGGKLLAIGWADGMVSCWIVDGRTRPTSTFSNSSQHNAMITLVKWNPVGKRLITGDKVEFMLLFYFHIFILYIYFTFDILIFLILC